MIETILEKIKNANKKLYIIICLVIIASYLLVDPPNNDNPTGSPTEVQTEAPTEVQTEAPTEEQTEAPTEVQTEAPVEVPKSITKDGKYIYDVSSYQDGLDLTTLTNLGGVIIRCGWGDDTEHQDDTSWMDFVEQCQNNNIPYGFYLFSYAIDDSNSFEYHYKSEIEHMRRFRDTLNPTLGCWLDIENEDNYKRANGWEDSEHVEQLNTYINEWLNTFDGGVYCDRYHTSFLNIPRNKLWLATLDGTIINDCVMCQFTSDPLDTSIKSDYFG